MAIRPAHRFPSHTARHAAEGDVQHSLAQHRQITKPPMVVLVDRQAVTSAPTAAQRWVLGGYQGDLDVVLSHLKIGYMKSLPEREASFII